MKTTLHIRQDTGTGDPIVLLHGIFADGTQWEKITELLKNDYRVIVVDLLGHGKSPRPKNASYTPDEHADALRNALASVNATENLTVVGYSMGGTVALSYCSKYPAGVRQLYMLSAPFYLSPDQMILNRYAASVAFTKFSGWFYGVIEKLLAPGKVLNFLVRYADRSDMFHKMIGANDNKLESHIIQLNIKNMINEFDFAGRLVNLPIPTTYYAGKKDPFIVQSQVYALKKFNPYIDIRRLDIIKVDHMLVQNLPKEIAGFVNSNKYRSLHAQDNGGSGSPIILLHGIESSSSYWQNVVAASATKHRVITIDLLGFGKSPQPKNIAYSTNQHIAALHDTIQTLGIHRYSIIGHSMGAVIGLAYAAIYPKEVTGLTLLSPVLLPEQSTSKKISVWGLQKIHFLPSVTELYSMLAGVLGDKRMAQFVPSIRSLENVIHKQQPLRWARATKNIPVTILYGMRDPLIDKSFIHQVAAAMQNASVTPLPSQYHNFSLTTPDYVINTINNDPAPPAPPFGKSIRMPRTIFKQIVSLAIPLLVLKSLLYIAIGLLLFTDYAAATLTIAVSLFIITQSYKTIRGAFSLKNEGLSYVGYIMLGGFIGLVGYGLLQHPSLSAKIAAYALCIIILLAGMIRIIVAFAWAHSKRLKRTLLLSGVPMMLLGVAAFLGSIRSVYTIMYALAVYSLVRGLLYLWYAFAAFVMAYIRGFNT